MSTETRPASSQSPDSSTELSHAPSVVARFVSRLARLRAWAGTHRLRSMIAAGVILGVIAGTIAIWAYLARLALQAERIPLETVLAALDDGRYEQARALAGTMLNWGGLPRSELGGPLFVLGAVKCHEAETQAVSEARRTDFLVASRYLSEARAFGLPAKREMEGLFLLGKSRLKSGQFSDGIETLEELLRILPADSPLSWQATLVLAESCFLMPNPDLEKARGYYTSVLRHPDLPFEKRSGALVSLARVLSRREDFDEARGVMREVPTEVAGEAQLLVLEAEIALDEVHFELQKSMASERGMVLEKSRPAVDRAIEALQRAQTLDGSGEAARRSAYLLGSGLELRGESDAALRQFVRTRQLYGDSPEGLAARLAEANLLRQSGNYAAALLAYRHVLENLPGRAAYRSVLLPLATVRAHMIDALADLVDGQRFESALELVSHFVPLFSRSEQLQFRGQTLQRWGDLKLRLAEGDGPDEVLRSAGRRRLREAAVAFEQLAKLRFATPSYTNDLWISAELFYRGQSFSDAARLLDLYLDHEMDLRTAQALLRLGQVYLALGKITQSVASFEECIEFYPHDGATFQARIDCAKAYWGRGDLEKAGDLLRDNLSGSALKPSSHEWKDSLFLLGALLHEKGSHEEAIRTLEEAIERYPDDPQRLMAQYIIGDSYRLWGQHYLRQQERAQTDNERKSSLQLASERLHAALSSFEEVQRTITLRAHDLHDDRLLETMLRNCYMFEASVLFDLGRYEEAIKSYSNVSALYPDEPFVLETFVQIANCWRRLQRIDKARGAVQQAQIALDRMPHDADFASATPFNREEWRLLLGDMSRW